VAALLAALRAVSGRRRLLATLVLVAATTSLTVAAQATAKVRSCGDIAQSRTHLPIYNVTTRGLKCRYGRRAALVLFHCGTGRCHVGHRVFHCKNLAYGEAVDLRCTSKRKVVRFQTGV
jgi:hypothetical protein